MLSLMDILNKFNVSNNMPCVNSLGILNACTAARAHIISECVTKTNSLAFVLVKDEGIGVKLKNDINTFLNKKIAFMFPARSYTYISVLAKSEEYEYERIDTLNKINNKVCEVIIATPEAISQTVMPIDKLCKNTLNLRKLEIIKEFDDFFKKLNFMGYKRVESVEMPGQFAIRGGIIDIFSPGSITPFRIELWDNVIENIFTLDTITNRRQTEQNNIQIIPAKEHMYDTQKLIAKIKEILKDTSNKDLEKTLKEDIEKLNAGENSRLQDKYIDLIYKKKFSILDYLTKDTKLFICDSYEIVAQFKKVKTQNEERIAYFVKENILRLNFEPYLSFEQIENSLFKQDKIIFENFEKTIYGFKVDQNVTLNFINTATLSTNFLKILEKINYNISSGYKNIIFAKNEKSCNSLKMFLNSKNIIATIPNDINDVQISKLNEVVILSGFLTAGIKYKEPQIAVLTYAEDLQNNFKNDYEKVKNTKQEHLQSLVDLNIGDYVVHDNHGIGIFKGIDQIKSEAIIKDYIKIEYARADTLYLPVTQLNMLSKYLGSSKNLKLNNLNGKEWGKTKFKVKKEIDNIAKELIILYSQRMQMRGYSFGPDTSWQNEFELGFEYEETEDQLRCIKEIKNDMESDKFMDRLLCGDVGVGKTEVALRAAFKCVMDSKQVAIIAPTTILAWQHYNTAINRFGPFPVAIESISRFKTKKDQKEIVKNLKNGKIDIIIGTHRLLQNDIEFYDIGLAIIDEEQRFGVKHKEHIKNLKKNIDVLSISATPIPRTLNMTIMGIKDISVINAPPQNRMPVQTYVLEYDENVIKESIRNELKRGGQVFYVHNRIDTIYSTAIKIQNMLGEDVRIIVAHGQMSHEFIQKSWQKLLDKQADVLVCTTIIETGVDIPNCNTLIIDDVCYMGLSQLHQLRGRVGRSNRRSFAYMFFKKDEVLSDIASKRLESIKEFAEFGAGLKIALRDLEIRGAGNILGATQHGHINQIGYDMYVKLLNQAILCEDKNTENAEQAECIINLAVTAFIPETYIENISTRLNTYKEMAKINTTKEANDFIEFMKDIYGKIPKSVENLIKIIIIKNTAQNLGIIEIKQIENNVNFYISKFSNNEIMAICKEIPKFTLNISKTDKYFTVTLNKNDNVLEVVYGILQKLKKMYE